MTDVVGRMVLHLTLVGIAELFEFICAGGGHGLDFLTVFQWDIGPQTPVENGDEIVQQFPVIMVRDYLEKFVGEDFFLLVKQLRSEFSDGLSTFEGIADDSHFPQSGLTESQGIDLRRIGRGGYGSGAVRGPSL